MKEWFAQLNQREQMSLLVLGVAVALYLLYMFVWSPLDTRREQLALQNTAIAESQVRVDAMVSQLLQLREGGAQAGGQAQSHLGDQRVHRSLPIAGHAPAAQQPWRNPGAGGKCVV